MKKPFVLIVSGPTAVGKSDLVEQLATMIPLEIINGDVGQLYTPLTIGTAKPAWYTSPTQHHLFDIIDTPQDLTVVEYAQRIKQKIAEVWQRNHLPVIVGGSGFYLLSLFFPPKQVVEPVIPVEENDPDTLWQQLYDVDPERATRIGKSDIYRLKRAFAVWQSTGQKPSSQAPTYEPVCDNFRFIFFMRDREELYTRINMRITNMIDVGWIDEVQVLRGTAWEPFLLRKKIIGYDDILLFLQQKNQSADKKEKMIDAIGKRTRHYAKRQMTFWRMLSKRLQQYAPHATIETMNISRVDRDAYLRHVAYELKTEIGI